MSLYKVKVLPVVSILFRLSLLMNLRMVNVVNKLSKYGLETIRLSVRKFFALLKSLFLQLFVVVVFVEQTTELTA